MGVLSKISTKAPKELIKEEVKLKTLELVEQLKELQNKLYAESEKSLLVVLQGLDASGKDGAVKAVFNSLNPMGIATKSFKKPNDEELSHDFLWRVHQAAPAKGMIMIFNRSHYEDILVPTVHQYIDTKIINKRYDHINDFEKLLKDNGTVVVKFYLHISKEEQQQRFLERQEDISKRWKFRKNDLAEAKLWDDYMTVYENIFDKCGKDNPWNIIPSDNKWYKCNQIASILVDKLKEMKIEYPKELKE